MLGQEWDQKNQGAESACTPQHTQDVPVSTLLSHIPCLTIEPHILDILFLHTNILFSGLELRLDIHPAPAWAARNSDQTKDILLARINIRNQQVRGWREL